jgi:uncharacterized Tic20 family protein
VPAEEPEKRPAQEVPAEPYDAAASDEPTVDTSAEQPEEEDPERVVPGEHPWAMACHLAVFANFFFLAGLFIPLLIRELKRSEDPEVEYHSKEALNFQLNVVPLGILMVVLVLMTEVCPLMAPACLGLPALVIAATGYAVIGAMKASEGKRYRYPFIKRLID